MPYYGDFISRLATVRATDIVYNLASAARIVSLDSGPLTVGFYSELAVDVSITAVSGTTPSATFSVDRQGADLLWYTVYTSAAQTVAGTLSTSVGVGAVTNTAFGDTVRLRWTITGTTPSFTFTASIKGK
jgi:hypothetical protein